MNTKHKEIMEQWENLKDRGLSHKMIGNFISASLLEQLEELERWVMEKDKKLLNKSNELEDTLSHIREQKEIIKNSK